MNKKSIENLIYRFKSETQNAIAKVLPNLIFMSESCKLGSEKIIEYYALQIFSSHELQGFLVIHLQPCKLHLIMELWWGFSYSLKKYRELLIHLQLSVYIYSFLHKDCKVFLWITVNICSDLAVQCAHLCLSISDLL